MSVLIKFHEVLFDPDIILGAGQSPVTGFPEFKNEHLRNEKTAVVKTNVGRLNPPEMLNLDLALLDHDRRAYFFAFYRGGFGSAIGFRFRVPYDYTVLLEGFAGPGGTQEPDGVITQFKLYKIYNRPGITSDQDVRRVIKPVVQVAKETNSFQLLKPDASGARVISNPLKIYFNDAAHEQTSGWTADAKTGVVTFSAAPATGTTILWSGEFDIPAAFLPPPPNQRFDVNSEINSIGIREILPAELKIS
jgi:hypothetical protein